MTQDNLRTLFGATGLVLLALAVDNWIVAQGGKPMIGASVLHTERPSIAYTALLICSVLLSLAASVGLVHSLRHGANWRQRIPIVWLKKMDPMKWDGALFQAIVLGLFIVVPMLALWFFADVVAKAELCERSTSKVAQVSDAWWSGIPDADPNEQTRLVHGLTEVNEVRTCVGGAEVYPPWSFLLVAFTTLSAGALSVAFVLSLFR